MKTTLPILKRLIGNPDAYAMQQGDGSWLPVRSSLTDEVLRRHLAGDYTVGTYLVKGDKARTLVFDIDSGDDAYNEAQTILETIGDIGLRGALEFSGRKGYHVWVVLPMFVFAKELRRLGLAVVAQSGVKCEVYPKQDAVRDLGNLMKLPGGIHRVTGAEAVLMGTPIPTAVANFRAALERIPETHATGGGESPPAFHCMHEIQEGISEGGRNIGLFHLAVMARRAGLNDENVALVVRQAAEKCDPPLDEVEVTALLESSKHSGPLCRQLEGGDLHCGEACILARVAGLRTRTGQVKHAAEGERVVVTVGKRSANLVEFEHDDLIQGKGALK